MSATTSRRIQVGENHFNLNESGMGNPHALLWLHGSGPGVTAMSNWEGALEALAEDFYNIAPDMLGFGDSSHPDPPPLGGAFMNARVDTLIELLDALDVGTVDIVGNSMGVAIGCQIAALVPDRVGRLVLMGGAAGPPAPTPGLKRIATFGDDPTVENLATILESFVFDPAPLASRLREIAELRVPRALREDVMRSHKASFDPAGGPPRPVDYGALGQPTLVVHGADDQVLLLESGLELFGLLPNAQMHIFGQCGHWTQIERANEFHAMVRDFLTRDR